jgi:hypothetical protein
MGGGEWSTKIGTTHESVLQNRWTYQLSMDGKYLFRTDLQPCHKYRHMLQKMPYREWFDHALFCGVVPTIEERCGRKILFSIMLPTGM